MRKALNLSIEGEGQDGQVLVVDGWPNFKTVDMPKVGRVVTERQPSPVYRNVVGESYSPGWAEAIGLLLILLWLAGLTMRVARLSRTGKRKLNVWEKGDPVNER